MSEPSPLSRPHLSAGFPAEGCGPLLAPDDPEPVILERPDGAPPFLVVCDHAGRAVPRRLGRLGAPEAAFERHIAWDIGAGAVASELGRRLGASVVRQAYSRLVVDCNRPLHVESLIPEVSDGTPIPANRGLSPVQRLQRVAAIHAPYHDAIERLIAQRLAERRPVILVAVHSFTPAMDGFERPWRFGVLHGGDSPFSARMLEALRAEEGEAAVGDNQPYALGPFDCTVPQHAQARGLDYLELEIRQDLIAEPEDQRSVAARVERLLRVCVA
jgi:predicted N-formylglutamate amidohydrolase